MKDSHRIPKVAFVQPVLAPYSIPRYQHLASAGDLEVHVILEAARFVERPGWHPRPIENYTVHIAKSLLTQKRIHNRELRYTETFTKAIPYGIAPLLYAISPDMVIFCNPTQLLCAIPFLLKKPCRIGLILEDTPQSQSHRSSMVCWLRRHLYRYLDFVFYFSKEAEKYYNTLELTANLYRSSWSIDATWLECERQSKPSGGAITFLFVGQLNPGKGVMLLLEAWRLFSQSEVEKKRLILVGEGPLSDDARNFCEKNRLDNVHFTGSIPYNHVKQHYQSSDVFVLPTMQDLFSLVVIEAMAHGLPVMTTIYNGAAELVLSNENGWIFDSKKVSSIMHALEKAWSKREMLPVMGEKSKQIISKYTHKAVMAKMRTDIQRELSKGPF